MDWPAPKSILFYWWNPLGSLWSNYHSLTLQDECFYVHHISIYWHSKRTDDGMQFETSL